MPAVILRLAAGLLLAPLVAVLAMSAWSIHGPGEIGPRMIWSAALFGLVWAGCVFFVWWPARAWQAAGALAGLCVLCGALVALN